MKKYFWHILTISYNNTAVEFNVKSITQDQRHTIYDKCSTTQITKCILFNLKRRATILNYLSDRKSAQVEHYLQRDCVINYQRVDSKARENTQIVI